MFEDEKGCPRLQTRLGHLSYVSSVVRARRRTYHVQTGTQNSRIRVTALAELMSELTSGEDAKSYRQRLCRLMVHVLAWVLCLISIVVSAMAVHYLSEACITQSPFKDTELVLPAVVSAINLLLPGLFNLCTWVENYDSPSVCVYVSIFRLGVLFAPLLPAVQILKLFVLFYMKKSSLLLNCQASKQPWRASQMTTLFVSLLFFPSYLGAAVSVTYTIWMIKPSTECGPFRNLTTMFQSGKLWVQQLESSNTFLFWLSKAYDLLVEHPLFLFLVNGVFLIMIYVHSQVVDGQRRIVSQLQKQIENEGKDKKFLITNLQALYERSNLVSPNR
ncbi:transmembrane channel-like protein 6 [Notothenia coriiceps]|uniref:Transmembrane channel-like protein n=1 Tax=Notothenia coriiceps TaxID=8208 RepID=A0A6I9N559_9TELE|nr:PREDICTED: transmembrane channel-like protein 6 [Notothenia coriiceps]